MKNHGILNIDEEEALKDLLIHPGFRPLLKAINQLVIDQEQTLVNYDLSEGTDGLLRLKLRAEGARKLSRDISTLKELVKKKGK